MTQNESILFTFGLPLQDDWGVLCQMLARARN